MLVRTENLRNVRGISLFPFLLAIIIALPDVSAMQEARIQALITVSAQSELARLLAQGDLDVMTIESPRSVRIVTNRDQLDQLQAAGFAVSIEIENMQDFYAARIAADNLGLFHTYSETEEFIDSLHSAYPTITSAKFSIGKSCENRDIWAMRITDNPLADESEPEVLFDGLHHAREPMSLEVVLNYMVWLCEGYGIDDLATFLVDNRDIWFVPIVNPDGYVYNELEQPMGGGMWRKNRRDNDDGTWGVDPNRNYPHEWGGIGASHDPASEIYCGPFAASEPEVETMINLMKSREFKAHITFHSVAGVILIPWSYSNGLPPDNWLLRRWGNEMAKYNGYPVGQGDELLYLCSGTAGDYAYSLQSDKARIMSCCIEVGGSGFWPLESEIEELNEQCLWPQILTTWAAGTYVRIGRTALSGGNGDDKPDAGELLDLSMCIENLSLSGTAADVAAELLSDDAYLRLHDAALQVAGLGQADSVSTTDDPFRFVVDTDTPDGHSLSFDIRMNSEGCVYEETLNWRVGRPIVSFYDDMESGSSNWIESDHAWNLTTADAHSPDHSYADSPFGHYSNFADSWIELTDPVDLSLIETASLSFWHRYDTEQGFDYCTVEGTTDLGETWTRLGPVYHGSNNRWEEVELSLHDFIGASAFSIRFHLVSDAQTTRDGWFIDDVQISEPEDANIRPSIPVIASPAAETTVYTRSPTFIVNNATDPDDEELTYAFMVYADRLCTEFIASAMNVRESSQRTEWTIEQPMVNGTYYWRSFADDGVERSLLTPVTRFGVDVAAAGLPTDVVLHPPSPNPATDGVTIRFELPARIVTTLGLHDLAGRQVMTLVNGPRGAGLHELSWDGKDSQDKWVPSGMYILNLEADSSQQLRKLVLLR